MSQINEKKKATSALDASRAGERFSPMDEKCETGRGKKCPHVKSGREGRLPPTSELTKNVKIRHALTWRG